MDRTQLMAFCDYAIGERPVGGTDPTDPVGTPHSPELRAFVLARLGALTPNNGYTLIAPGHRAQHGERAKAFANLLREVADGIDPPITTEA